MDFGLSEGLCCKDKTGLPSGQPPDAQAPGAAPLATAAAGQPCDPENAKDSKRFNGEKVTKLCFFLWQFCVWLWSFDSGKHL